MARSGTQAKIYTVAHLLRANGYHSLTRTPPVTKKAEIVEENMPFIVRYGRFSGGIRATRGFLPGIRVLKKALNEEAVVEVVVSLAAFPLQEMGASASGKWA
ncbi:hypothetical protein LTR09_012425 [Extremus antarcticus]|uniref:Uncharacterized protein n=1 Tax=Extremus antarcticus TaxID=702011 RepID=A0AAJ0DA34_9PEZI|nr:hypothetical protein LTR09_012425 [Extremus antarcticus]